MLTDATDVAVRAAGPSPASALMTATPAGCLRKTPASAAIEGSCQRRDPSCIHIVYIMWYCPVNRTGGSTEGEPMELKLAGRVVLVTGASSGIGHACVRQLLHEGARVIACARGRDRLDETMSALAAQYPRQVVWDTADVRVAEDVERLVSLGTDEFGALDMIVNNAGKSRLSTLDTTSRGDWIDELSLKFFGVLNPIEASRQWLRQSDAASVVNLSATLARQPDARMIATSASRAGLLNLSKSLATTLGTEGIRVNSVAVGAIDTGQWKPLYQSQKTDLSFDEWASAWAVERGYVIPRFGTSDEVAAAILFLLSPVSGYTTGAVLDINGGSSRYV